MSRYRIDLPGFAELYLKETNRRKTKNQKIVVLFHGWLRRTGRELAALTGKDVAEFVSGPRGRPVGQMTRNDYRYHVRLYLRWLAENGFAGPFEANELEGYHRKPLPDELRRFLRFITPTRRSSTVKGYRFVLRRFHRWLADRGTALANVDREACLAWVQYLDARGLHPATRVGELVCTRKYLDWLWEQGVIPNPGYEMIGAGDLPKKPDYLPRPLPPDADHELQNRLKQSESPVAKGLYIMRRTGLRIGELRRLERNCVRDDHSGNHFLKVPLGKLNNERLVPLDDATLAAIHELQDRTRDDSPWLIEGARHRPVHILTYRSTLRNLGGDLPLAEPLTTHRLRHTYATALMNGGMSLPGIMKLLGHRDHRMTLRYTQIADATVHREYFEALSRIADRYAMVQPDPDSVELDPVALLEDVIRWVRKNLWVPRCERGVKLLIRRLEGARDELEALCAEAQSAP
jgi:site-specific recombinase XerD